MPAAQTGRCRRCGGDLGPGSQQGVCLECIKRLQAARRARESGRRVAQPGKKASSVRRESVRSFTCTDCGKQFFEVDLASRRIVMVDGQPVCAACLKKRKGMGPLPMIIGAAVIVVGALILAPKQMLAGLFVAGLVTIALVLYYSTWATRTRAIMAGIALVTIAVSALLYRWMDKQDRLAADAEAVRPLAENIDRLLEEGLPQQVQVAIQDLKDSIAKEGFLHFPDRQQPLVEKYEKLLAEREKAIGLDPAVKDLYWHLMRLFPGDDLRWGDKRPIEGSTLQVKALPEVDNPEYEPGGPETLELRNQFEVLIDYYAPDNYRGSDGKKTTDEEVSRILIRAHQYAYSIYYRVSVRVLNGDDKEVGLYSLDDPGLMLYQQRSREDDMGERVGVSVLDFCRLAKWRP
jgi:hypothetical protein